MPRPIWKGHISFGLVNIPVVLYSAEKKFDIQFKLIDSRDNARIRYLRVNEQTGKEVPWNAITKGYEYEEGSYVLLKDKDIKSMAGENFKTIDIECFINKSSIDSIDFDKPYYLVPDKNGDKGYVILREILNSTKKVGVAKVMIHSRQYLAVVMPYDNAIILNILHYHREIRMPSEFELPTKNFKSYKISEKEIEIATELVSLMTKKWDPNAYHDDFRETLQNWIEEQIRHEKPTKKRKAISRKTSNVTDFVELLRKSLKEKKVGHKEKLRAKRAKQSEKKRGSAA